MKRINNERGAVTIVEATFVFPIMFFVLFFLLFYGNAVYVKSHIDATVTKYTIQAAAEISDPLLSDVVKYGKVGQNTPDGKPYRYLSTGYGNSVVHAHKGDIEKDIKSFGGFFQKMTPKSVQCEGKFNNYVLYQTVRYDVKYNLQIPIKMIFSNNVTVMKFASTDEEPVNDTSELVLNTNMVIDYVERTGLDEKIKQLTDKVKSFF